MNDQEIAVAIHQVENNLNEILLEAGKRKGISVDIEVLDIGTRESPKAKLVRIDVWKEM